MLEAEATPATAPSLLQRPGIRQFIKFCIIGASSAVIDLGLCWVLTYSAGWNLYVARCLSFALAVTNGFVWNSLWTFKGLGSGAKHEQYTKFVAVNVVGLVLNVAIMKCVFFVFTGQLVHQGTPDKFHTKIALGIAVVCVSLWNFFANKHYTFRPAPDGE